MEQELNKANYKTASHFAKKPESSPKARVSPRLEANRTPDKIIRTNVQQFVSNLTIETESNESSIEKARRQIPLSTISAIKAFRNIIPRKTSTQLPVSADNSRVNKDDGRGDHGRS